MRIEFVAGDGVREAIVRLGRTEDLHFAPGSRRLAIAGLVQSRILILDVSLDPASSSATIDDYTEVNSSGFNYPHGVFWLDADTLAVASRRSTLTLIAVPPSRSNSHSVEVTPLASIGQDDVDLLRGPGSVAAMSLGPGLYELAVCNNFSDCVSQHLVEVRGNTVKPLTQSIMAARHLSIPDGVCYSPSGRFIAASGHEEGAVVIYRNDARLNRQSEPDGILSGMDHPHGVRFSPDERFVLAADAGAPVVRVFHSADGDWTGYREPSESLQVIDDAAFARGHYRAAEGGPKGIDVDETGTILAATCEEQPLAFFAIGRELDRIGSGRGAAVRVRAPDLEGMTRARHQAAERERGELPAIREALQKKRYRGLTGKLRRVKHWYEGRPRRARDP